MRTARLENRTQVDIPVELTHARSGVQRSGRAKDISLGGLRIEMDEPLPFGESVLLHLRLPGSTRLFALDAVVRWTRPGTIGVQLGTLGALETHLITQLSLATPQTLDAGDVAWVG